MGCGCWRNTRPRQSSGRRSVRVRGGAAPSLSRRLMTGTARLLLLLLCRSCDVHRRHRGLVLRPGTLAARMCCVLAACLPSCDNLHQSDHTAAAHSMQAPPGTRWIVARTSAAGWPALPCGTADVSTLLQLDALAAWTEMHGHTADMPGDSAPGTNTYGLAAHAATELH